MTKAPTTDHAPAAGIARQPSSAASLDSIGSIIGWTLVTVLGFWSLVALVAFALIS
jgi:hypothetical protein